jgi:hypothetical protein
MGSMDPGSRPARQLRKVYDQGPHGGPTYGYRGAVINASRRGTVFTFRMKGFPNGGWTGARDLGFIVRLVDVWLDAAGAAAARRTGKSA